MIMLADWVTRELTTSKKEASKAERLSISQSAAILINKMHEKMMQLC
jgi:hypothetical protein